MYVFDSPDEVKTISKVNNVGGKAELRNLKLHILEITVGNLGGMGQQIIGGDGAPNYWRGWGKIIGGDVYPPSPP